LCRLYPAVRAGTVRSSKLYGRVFRTAEDVTLQYRTKDHLVCALLRVNPTLPERMLIDEIFSCRFRL
jgi:hypothetical protein